MVIHVTSFPYLDNMPYELHQEIETQVVIQKRYAAFNKTTSLLLLSLRHDPYWPKDIDDSNVQLCGGIHKIFFKYFWENVLELASTTQITPQD